MKRAYLICLLQSLTATLLFSQSNPVPLVNLRPMPPSAPCGGLGLAFRRIVVLLTAGLFALPLLGQTNDAWLGGTGNWSDGSKWSAGVPTASSNVFIDNGSGTASAVTVDVAASCNNLTIDSDDSLTIPSGITLTVNGTTISNEGHINITDNPSSAVLNIAAGHSVMLIGHGTVTLTDSLQTGGALISGGSGSTLINSSTIQGSGEIGHSAGMALINESGGVINANQPRVEKSLLASFPAGITNQGLMEATGTGVIIFGTTINNSGGAITASGGSVVLNSGVIEGGTLIASSDSSMQNMGVLKSSNGGVLTLSGLTNLKTIQTQGNGSKVLVPGTITNYGNFSVGCGTLFEITGTFTNFFGTTLVGGHYSVCGKLQFTGANIVNNEAYITLTGASSAIVDQANNDGLRNLASTGSGYSLSLTSGRDTTTPGSYSNSGTLAVDRKTKFTVNGSYTQTQVNQKIPRTKVDGVLTVPSGTTIQRGSLLGIGSIASTVVSSGSVTAGDTATKPGILSLSTYTQNSGNLSMLNIAIGGLNVGAQYSQLAVLNGASLNGPLNITRINGFVPAIGNTFTILTASAVSGTFSTVNGLSINSSEHFTITYNPTNVTLTVVPGP